MRTILQYQPICTTAGNNNSNNYIYKEKYLESIFQSLAETARHRDIVATILTSSSL